MPQKIAYHPIDISKAGIHPLHHHRFSKQAIEVDALRLDLVHPIVSGNKWFKLKYHLQQAIAEKSKGIITFGGAWSNHLVATAYACRQSGLPALGIVRGERPATLAAALQDAQEYGMQLRFTERKRFARENELISALQQEYPGHLVIPQGGRSAYGVQGAAEILQLVPLSRYTHIVCAAGTGTMLAGIVQGSMEHQQVIGISVLKIPQSEKNSISAWVEKNTPKRNFIVLPDYHLGGYARMNESLIRFMNDLYSTQQVPTDFVYTAKLFSAVYDLAGKKYFPPRSHVLIIHSGGLQGNRSLEPGILTFQ